MVVEVVAEPGADGKCRSIQDTRSLRRKCQRRAYRAPRKSPWRANFSTVLRWIPSIAEAAFASTRGSSGGRVAIVPLCPEKCPISRTHNLITRRSCSGHDMDKPWPNAKKEPAASTARGQVCGRISQIRSWQPKLLSGRWESKSTRNRSLRVCSGT